MRDRSGLSSRRTATALLVAMAAAAVLFAEARRHPVGGGAAAPAAAPVAAVTPPLRARGLRAAATGALTPPVAIAADAGRSAPPAAPLRAVPGTRHRRYARAADPKTLAPVTSSAAPRSIQLVTLAVPQEIPASDTVDWHVSPTGRAEVLSPPTGTLAPSPDPRSVLIVTRVPADAPAGITRIATAEFDGPAGSVSVPVDLRVTRVRRADIRLVRSMYAARPGTEFTVELQLANRGNAADTLSVAATIPDGWRMLHPPQPVILRPGQERSMQVLLQIPATANPTRAYVRVAASAADTKLAEATADVEVLDPVLQGRHGPVLTTALGSVAGDSTGATPVVSLDLSGFYDERTTVTGHFARALDPSDVNNPGLGRIGMYLGQAFLNVANPTWQAGIGATGRTFNPVNGMNAYGVGLSGGVDLKQWHGAAMLAEPSSGNDGHLLGGEVGYRAPVGTVTATATDFEESSGASGFARSLQTMGLGFLSRSIEDTRLSAAAAWRNFAAGSGLGWSVGADRLGRNDFASLALTHTPGGANAYAQATNQFVITGSKRLNERLNVHGSFTDASDQNSTFTKVQSQNWSLGSGIQLDQVSTLNLDLNADDFTADDQLGIGRGNKDLRGTAALRSRIRRFDTELSVTAAQLSRPLTFNGTKFDAPAAAQAGVEGSIGWTNMHGRFDATASYTYSGPQSGYFPQALVLGATASGVAVSSNPKIPTFNASVQRMEWFGARAGATIIRVGTMVQLGGDYRLTVDVERNPFLHAGSSSVPFVAALKLERGFVLPFSHRSAAAHGLVYEDLNGNGVRDPGEPGLGGVMVRRGGEVAISEPSGEFRLYDQDDRSAAIDATSLALGAVPGAPGALPGGALALPVIPTSALDVTLVAGVDELGRSPATKDFSAVVVVARDANGTVWTAQADSAGRARLDALPPGRYTISADFSSLNERLRVTGAAPMVEIKAGEAVPPVTLSVVPFTVKMFNAVGGSPTSLAKERK